MGQQGSVQASDRHHEFSAYVATGACHIAASPTHAGIVLGAKELLVEYSVYPASIITERSGLYANGIPSELHDETRCVGATTMTYVCRMSPNPFVLCLSGLNLLVF